MYLLCRYFCRWAPVQALSKCKACNVAVVRARRCRSAAMLEALCCEHGFTGLHQTISGHVHRQNDQNAEEHSAFGTSRSSADVAALILVNRTWTCHFCIKSYPCIAHLGSFRNMLWHSAILGSIWKPDSGSSPAWQYLERFTENIWTHHFWLFVKHAHPHIPIC